MDSKEQILKRIIDAYLECGLDRVIPEARLVEDLRADDLAMVELLLAVEEAFDFEIPDNDDEQIHTVGDLIAYVKAHAV